MEYAFTDSNGKRYYRYLNDFEMPILRMGQLQLFLSEWKIGIDDKEFDLCIETALQALNGQGKSLTGEPRNGHPDIVGAGFILMEMKTRKNLVINNDIFMKIVACLYISENQTPDIWDEEIERIKINQFKKDTADGGLWDFFYSAGLTKYFPFLESIKGSFTELAEQTRIKTEALSRLLLASLQMKLESNLPTDKKS